MSEFSGAGVKPGVEVWRIEKLVPTPVPAKMYGQFYDGDAYIILKTTQKPASSSLEWDLFFWLGEECSQDEQGVAAYKTVELDEALGGGPVQHRELQEHESELFMQCFNKVEYLKGGVASGFKHVERDVYEPRLLRVKGKKTVRVKAVPMTSASLNAGDVFILDLGMSLIQWNGAEANRKEKAKALDVCTGIDNDERGGKATVDACEQGSEPEEFWTALGGKGPVAPAVADDVRRASMDAGAGKGVVKLLKVSDASGSVSTSVVASGELKKEMLDTTDCYLLDNETEIYVWIGKEASADEKKSGMKVASDYVAKNSLPKTTRVIKVPEGAEPTIFKMNFVTWTKVAPLSIAVPGGNVASPGELVKSGSALVAGLGLDESALERMEAEKKAMQDAGNGTIDCYRIEGFEPVKVDESLEGIFYAGDSYIVKYVYEKDGKEMCILYFWLGRTSTQDEKGAAAMLTTKMDDDMGGAATQVRVVMGKEPLHFVRCFHGRMVVHSGGKASGFKNRGDADEYDKDGISLFHVRGTCEDDTRAVQVEEKAASLNSGDCFVLKTPAKKFVWMGEGANETEHATAVKVAGTFGGERELVEVKEGSEPDDFWSAIGGKGEYPKVKALDEASRDPLLFSCSNADGSLDLEPIYHYSQEDLLEEDVFLLDTYTTIFIWIGSESNADERKGAEEAAQAYIGMNKRGDDTAVVTIKSGQEPGIFTCNFLGWSSTKKKAFVDPYEAKLEKLRAAKRASMAERKSVSNGNGNGNGAVDVSDAPAPPPPKPAAAVDLSQDFAEPGGASYTFNYEELKKPASELPKGVDPTKREQYLSDDEFLKVLGSPRSQFEQLKPWKQQQLKKAKGLF